MRECVESSQNCIWHIVKRSVNKNYWWSLQSWEISADPQFTGGQAEVAQLGSGSLAAEPSLTHVPCCPPYL